MRQFQFAVTAISAALIGCAAGGKVLAAAVQVSPYPVVAGEPVVIKYDPTGRLLANAGQVFLHYGFNEWAGVPASDPPMTWNAAEAVWQFTVDVPANTQQLDVVFQDGQDNWDNNDSADWHLFVSGGDAGQWSIDGNLDPDATLIASNNGTELYAGLRGSVLYVAAPQATNGNDHFIFIADTPGPPVGAPWDKSGTVAAWSAFLGNEVDNGWIGWFNATGSTATSAGAWMEGTIDVAAEFGGTVPGNLSIAFGPYPTDSGAALDFAAQVPASTDADSHLDSSEYVQVTSAALTVGCATADLDADCDFDSDDLGLFADCLAGTGVTSCTSSDLDADADIDLADYALLQQAVGELAPPGIVAEDVGPQVTRFLPAGVNLADLPPSMSLAITPQVVGPATAPLLEPVFFQSGSRMVAWFDVGQDVSLYGTGEIAGRLSRREHTTEAWNTDAYGYGPGNPSLYQSHPWVLGLRPDGTAFGVLADTTYRCRIELTGGILFAAEGPAFPVYLFDGPTPQAVIERLTDFIGRIALPPRWALGYQQSRYSYVPESNARALASEFRSRDIPCDVIWFDIDYMDGFRIFTFDPFGFPDPLQLNVDLHGMGYHTVWMINPGVKAETGYFVNDEGTAGDHWVYRPDGSIYTGEVWPGQAHFPDYTRPQTRTWWSGLYADYMALGIDGVWNDLNEPGIFDGPGHSMPVENIHRGGGGLLEGTHAQYHNVYGMLMVQASRAGIVAANPMKRPFVLSRANFMGGHRYAAMWTGDNWASWQHLNYATPMVLNIGLSGQPFAGPDLGGFIGDGSADLFARWMGVGVFMPFCRAHSDNVGMDKEPWSFGTAVENTCRIAIQRRYRLMPYLYTLFREATQNGLPIVRPVFFADPSDPSLRGEDTAFLLGADLLVVPNLTENPAAAPPPALPAGTWRTLALVGEDSTTDVNQPDVRIRGGSIVPLGPVMEYTDEAPLDPLTLVVCLDGIGQAEGWLYEDAGDGYGFQTGDYRLARYSAHQDNNTVVVAVTDLEGQRPTTSRPVNIQVITAAGVVIGQGTDAAGGLVGTVNLP